jgi:hypothetical protein
MDSRAAATCEFPQMAAVTTYAKRRDLSQQRLSLMGHALLVGVGGSRWPPVATQRGNNLYRVNLAEMGD